MHTVAKRFRWNAAQEHCDAMVRFRNGRTLDAIVIKRRTDARMRRCLERNACTLNGRTGATNRTSLGEPLKIQCSATAMCLLSICAQLRSFVPAPLTSRWCNQRIRVVSTCVRRWTRSWCITIKYNACANRASSYRQSYINLAGARKRL